MKRIMGVYDVDPFYADRFADFANQREKVPFTVLAFTTLEALRDYSKEHKIEILLISAGVDKRELEKLGVGQIITLTDGDTVKLSDQYPCVYKYQSSDSIIREVMACYCEKPLEEAFTVLGGKGRILGIYSPVNRCLKTSFALTLGQLLAQDTKALYLNLEEFSGFSRLMNEEYQGSLSDVLYFYRQGNYSWIRLNSVVYTWGSLDYIPPVRYPEDLCQMGPEELAGFLERMAAESAYEVIIVDMGQMGRKSTPVLEVCDIVYMPVKDDGISAAKIEEFEEYLDISGLQCLKEKIKKLKLPYHNSFGRRDTYMEQLLWGELGDYVRQLVKGTKLWNS